MSNTVWKESNSNGLITFTTQVVGKQRADDLRCQVNAWIAERHGSFEKGFESGEYSVLSFIRSREDDILKLTVWLNDPTNIEEFKLIFG